MQWIGTLWKAKKRHLSAEFLQKMVLKCYVARFSFVLYIIGEQTFKIKNKHQIIITMHKFTKLILDEYNRQGIKVTDQNESAAYVSPLIELSDAQKDILSKGDGQNQISTNRSTPLLDLPLITINF